MAFTNFCCRSGGSNLNAGTLTGNSTEPGTAASFTYASGNWVAATGVFTVASGNPSSDGVAVGDFASVYADGSTVTGFVGRVTARDATTITVSLTAKAGTAPTDGTGNRTLKIGGAWKGPNAAEAFPFVFLQNTLTNSAGDTPRVNLKNDATYSITANMAHANTGPMIFEGYTTAYGDQGLAIIDGGTSGASYVLLTVSISNFELANLKFQNNGATGNSNGVNLTNGGVERIVRRCVFSNVRGNGLHALGAGDLIVECEAFACNANNSATFSGFSNASNGPITYIRCISHDNTGSNANGFYSALGATYIGCIAETNGADGFLLASVNESYMLNCESYNNTGDGLELSATSAVSVFVENCSFLKNGGYGVNGSGSGARHGYLVNCGFGSGTQANTSGTTTGLKSIQELSSVTYAADVTPWVDPANGDFRITLAAAKNAGRGAFTQTAASYAGTVSYPNIGSNQHQDDISIGVANYAVMQGYKVASY